MTLKEIYGHDMPGARFYTIGRSVFLRWDGGDTNWIEAERLHETDIARRMADQRAEATAYALNQYFGCGACRKIGRGD